MPITGLVCLRTGKFVPRGSEELPSAENGVAHMWKPVEEAEPYFTQNVGSSAQPLDRSEDGRFDQSHLDPEKAWRIGRDYLAHCIRYGWPMRVVKEHFGAGVRIMEMGCGKLIPLFRTLTCDHSAVMYYKPSVYVAADLNEIKYRPHVTGCDTTILPNCNVIDDVSRVPDVTFDLVISFEVLEHMDKIDGERFLDAMVALARRKSEREDKPGMILLSTPVNSGRIAKNHVYEWHRAELRRAFERRGCRVVREFGTFSNLRDLERALTPEEVTVWNMMADYHSPHVLSCLFSAMHPEAARNIAWQVEVTSGSHGVHEEPADQPLDDNQTRILPWIDVEYEPDMQALEVGMVRLCRVPFGTRIKYRNEHRATDKEVEFFIGEVKCGVTGPGEGVMMLFDHDLDRRHEVNPHRWVEVLWKESA